MSVDVEIKSGTALRKDIQKALVSVLAYWGGAYSVAWNIILWMPIYAVSLLFVKQAIALPLLVLIPVSNQFGYLSSEYQLPNFIKLYFICHMLRIQQVTYNPSIDYQQDLSRVFYPYL
jgi:hypothetical protein